MRTRTVFVFFLALSLLLAPAAFAGGLENYFEQMGYYLRRGTGNVLTSPLEIPRGIDARAGGEGYSGVRHLSGFTDGTFRMFSRAMSGVWDFVVAFIPGQQTDGIPLEPATIPVFQN